MCVLGCEWVYYTLVSYNINKQIHTNWLTHTQTRFDLDHYDAEIRVPFVDDDNVARPEGYCRWQVVWVNYSRIPYIHIYIYNTVCRTYNIRLQIYTYITVLYLLQILIDIIHLLQHPPIKIKLKWMPKPLPL